MLYVSFLEFLLLSLILNTILPFPRNSYFPILSFIASLLVVIRVLLVEISETCLKAIRGASFSMSITASTLYVSSLLTT